MSGAPALSWAPGKVRDVWGTRPVHNRFRTFWKRADWAERWSRGAFQLATQTKGLGRFAKRMVL